MKQDFYLELDGSCGWDSSEWKGGSSFWLMNHACSVRNPAACIDITLQQRLNKQIHKIRSTYLTDTKASFLYLLLETLVLKHPHSKAGGTPPPAVYIDPTSLVRRPGLHTVKMS